MKRFIQFTPLFIRHFSTTEWPFPIHNHNHLELMFVHRGSGIHQLNGKNTPYQGKCLFFLAPNDAHLFTIERETEFSVLKFSYEYLQTANDSRASKKWNLLIDDLLIEKEHINPLYLSESELHKLETLFRLIILEWTENQEKTTEVMLPYLQSILLLLKKNCEFIPQGNALTTAPVFLSVIRHIHEYIQQPDQISIQFLSQHFKISRSHLSRLFKIEMDISIKKYINEYKYKRIENRLLYSEELIKSISEEFGFTDLSHFNKFVKVQSEGVNPKELRQQKK